MRLHPHLLGWKYFPVTNTLAYFHNTFLSFARWRPGEIFQAMINLFWKNRCLLFPGFENYIFKHFWAQAEAKAESLQHSIFKKNWNKIKGLNLSRWWRKEMNMIEKLAVYLGNCDKFYFTFKFAYWMWVQIFQSSRRTKYLFAIYQTSQIWILINQ